MKFSKLFLFNLLFFISFFLVGKEIIIEKDEVIDINKETFIFQDQNSILSFQDILQDSIQKKFTLNTLSTPNYGHTHSTIWIKFTAQNKLEDFLYLYISPVWLDTIFYYYEDEQGHFQEVISGASQPFETRALEKPNYFFNLHLKKGETKTFYVAIKSQHIISFHLQLGTLIQFDYKSHSEDALFFLYIGIMLLLCSYNLFLAIGTKRKGNIFYGLYILFLIISMFYIKGYTTNFFDSPWLAVHSNINVAIMMFFLALSISHFTNIIAFSKPLFYVRYVVLFFATFSVILNISGYAMWANIIVVNLSFVGGIWGLGIAITLIKHKVSFENIFIFFAFMCFMLGGIMHVLMIKGIIKINLFTENVFMLGSGIEVIFLSISFSLSIQRIKKDRYRTQQKLLQITEENRKLVLERAKELEKLVHQRTLDLEYSNNELRDTIEHVRLQKKIIENKSKHINDSINYAKNIQNALLPPFSLVKKLFPDFFVLYKPKDVLSGDIYWIAEYKNKKIAAAIDCTGHGVPGALMSMTAHGILQQIVFEKKITQPNIILNELHNGIRYALKQDYTDTDDGLDIALISYDQNTKELQFSGAKNPLIYIQNNEIVEVKGDRVSVGGIKEGKERNFQLHSIELKKDTHIYLSSDGYQDQFGGKEGKKFMKKSFKEKLFTIHQLPLKQQAQNLEITLNNWKGDIEQVDDILVMGLFISPDN